MVLITHVPPSYVGIGSNQYSDPLGIAQQRRWCTMRRILLVLSVAALVAVMAMASAVPAFAEGFNFGGCQSFTAQTGTSFFIAGEVTPSEQAAELNPRNAHPG